MDWTVFDDRAVGNQANFRQGRDHVCLQPHDLIALRVDPSAPLQGNRVRWARVAYPIAPNRIRLVGSLPEMHLPGDSSIPPCQSFAVHLVISRMVRMENERKSWQPQSCYPVREFLLRRVAFAIYFKVEKSRLHFLNGSHVIKLARFPGRGQSPFVD